MVNWKNTIKKIGSATGKGIVKGIKITANEVEKKAKNVSRKNTILKRMSDKQIKQMAHHFGIKPSIYFDEKPTIDDYQQALVMNLSVNEVIEYARRTGIKVDDVISAVQKDTIKEDIKKYQQKGIENLQVEVATSIQDFKPSRYYSKEFSKTYFSKVMFSIFLLSSISVVFNKFF